jgi:homoserine kinase
MDSIRVFAPATVANVTCGFDILGFAVDRPGDELVLRKNNSGELRIARIHGDGGALPTDIGRNTCGVVLSRFLDRTGFDRGIEVELTKMMPLGSGLGSSAASAVAAAFAVNELFGRPLSRDELLPITMEAERMACGAAHADNVAPGLYGGFVLVRSYDPLDVVKLPVAGALHAAIVHPQIEVKTKDAREILRKEIYFCDSVKQSGNVAGLVAGLLMPDYGLISRSMHDYIVEPIRAILIPGYREVKAAALESGALGAGISGSGPSLFALSASEAVAEKAGERMRAIYRELDIQCDLYLSEINQEGPRILD